MENKKLASALRYAKLGMCIFPVHNIIEGNCSCGVKECKNAGKHPRTKRGFKDATCDEKTIRIYWRKWPDANIGCATGEVSGIVVLDIDSKHNRSSKEFTIPPTVCARSGGGGEHFMFKYPGKHTPSSNGQLFGEGVDIKADNGYIILDPSSHKSGGYYEWILDPETTALAEMPDWLEKAIQKHEGNKLWQIDPSEISEGSRNHSATSMAGKIRSLMPSELRDTMGWANLIDWNQKMPSPLSEKELQGIWRSVKKYDSDKFSTKKESEKEDSPVQQIINIILNESEATLFHDDKNEAYIYLKISDHHEIWPCKSKTIKLLLSNISWKVTKGALGSEQIKNIVSVLEAKARFEGPKIKLHNRVAWHNDELWYDLTNEKWQAIKVNRNGWEIVDKPPVLFKRYSHHKPQVLPEHNGNVKLLLKYVNIYQDESKLLLLIFLITCFIPDFPHVMLVIFGAQGSSKSTLSKLLRSIIDPSIIEVVGMPHGQKELVQTLAHHHFIFFDNLSYISEETSDTFCKAITGSGFTKRELYEDDGDIIYNFMRCIGINGINLVTTRPDLLERSLLIELQRIEPEKRKSEKELYREFETDLPLILGEVFDILADALKIKDDTTVTNLPRMADFALWGCIIAKALQYRQEEFLAAYNNNIQHQTEMLVNENIVATAIITFMDDKKDWKGTPTELLERLYSHAMLTDINTREAYWPKGANVLSRRLNELSTALKKLGISIETRTSGTERSIYIQKEITKTDDTDSIF